MTDENSAWEYKVADLGLDRHTWPKRLATLGRQGWELVNVVQHVGSRPGGVGTQLLFEPCAIFKRRSLEASEPRFRKCLLCNGTGGEDPWCIRCDGKGVHG